MACCCLLRGSSSIVATDTLTSGTEEALHAVKTSDVRLSRLLRLTLAVIHFVVGSLVLEIPTVVAETILRAIRAIGLDRLHLVLEGIIYALSLVHRVVQALRACDRLHGNVGAQRHALMDVAG